jgi:hypothetical protein
MVGKRLRGRGTTADNLHTCMCCCEFLQLLPPTLLPQLLLRVDNWGAEYPASVANR